MKLRLLCLALLCFTQLFGQQITTNNIDTSTPICATKAFAVTFSSSGFVTTGRVFTAQVSDAAGAFTTPIIIGSAISSPISVVIPASLVAGNGYKIRVITDLTTTVTYTSSAAFTLYKPMTATLTGATTINVGESANLSLAFTGTSPWSYVFSNTNTGTTTTSPFVGVVQPTVTTTYQLSSVSNICGAGTSSGTAKVKVIPKITVGSVPSSLCVGSGITVPFTLTGAFDTTGVVYTAQLSDAAGSFTNPVSIGTGVASPISVNIPANTPSTSGYKIRLITNVASTNVISNSFNVRPTPTATISGTTTINVGQSTTLALAFTGDAPFNYTLSNGTTGTATTNSVSVNVSPTVNTTYGLQSVNNVCGSGTTSGSASVTVIPRVEVKALASNDLCVGAAVAVPFEVVGAFVGTTTFTAQLSDANGNFTTPTIIGTATSSPINTALPTTLPAGGNYQIRVVANGATYTNSSSLVIKQKPSASISGTNTINVGQSAALSLAFVGNPPYNYTLSDGTTGVSTGNSLSINVNPTTTTTYTIQSVSNVCGTGITSSNAKITVIPRINTSDQTLGNVCVNATASLPFTITGGFDAIPTFTAQLSDASGSFTSPVTVGSGSTTPITIKIPTNTIAGTYKVRVISNLVHTTTISPNFSIKPLPTATLTGTTSINFGDMAGLTLSLVGDLPINYQLSDGTSGIADKTPINISIRPNQTTTYSLTSLQNTCGMGSFSGSAVVTVIPRLVTSIGTELVCAGAKLNVSFGIGGVLPTNITYQAQLSDSLGDFSKPTIIGTATVSPIATTIPDNLPAGGKYKIRTIAVGQANTNLLTSNTFAISTPPTATITGGGKNIVKFGEEVLLVIQFTGNAPWQFVLSDNVPRTATTSPAIIPVIPDSPVTYTLKSVSNSCGTGIVSGTASVNVLIMSVLNSSSAESIIIKPNPAIDYLTIESTKSQVISWELLTIYGQRIQTGTQSTIAISQYLSGTYILKIKTKDGWHTRKVVMSDE